VNASESTLALTLTISQVAPESAHVAAVIVVLLANVLGGYNPRLDELQAMGLGWLGELSYARWLLEALFINELQVRHATPKLPSEVTFTPCHAVHGCPMCMQCALSRWAYVHIHIRLTLIRVYMRCAGRGTRPSGRRR
jgi:hypothetical protein